MNLAGFCRNCMAKWYHAGAKVHGPVALSLAIFTFFILFLELFFAAFQFCVRLVCVCEDGHLKKQGFLSTAEIESQECQCNTRRPASGSMVSLTQTGRKRIKRKRAARRGNFVGHLIARIQWFFLSFSINRLITREVRLRFLSVNPKKHKIHS